MREEDVSLKMLTQAASQLWGIPEPFLCASSSGHRGHPTNTVVHSIDSTLRMAALTKKDLLRTLNDALLSKKAAEQRALLQPTARRVLCRKRVQGKTAALKTAAQLVVRKQTRPYRVGDIVYSPFKALNQGARIRYNRWPADDWIVLTTAWTVRTHKGHTRALSCYEGLQGAWEVVGLAKERAPA